MRLVGHAVRVGALVVALGIGAAGGGLASADMGTVNWFNPTKGWGFIARDGGGADVFVHVSAIVGPTQVLQSGQRVSFVVAPSPKGLEAYAVEIEGDVPATGSMPRAAAARGRKLPTNGTSRSAVR